jgi:hypothetical protein
VFEVSWSSAWDQDVSGKEMFQYSEVAYMFEQ